MNHGDNRVVATVATVGVEFSIAARSDFTDFIDDCPALIFQLEITQRHFGLDILQSGLQQRYIAFEKRICQDAAE